MDPNGWRTNLSEEARWGKAWLAVDEVPGKVVELFEENDGNFREHKSGRIWEWPEWEGQWSSPIKGADRAKGSRFADMRVSNPTRQVSKKSVLLLPNFFRYAFVYLPHHFRPTIGSATSYPWSDLIQGFTFCSCVADELCTLKQLFFDAACLPTWLLGRLRLDRQPVNPGAEALIQHWYGHTVWGNLRNKIYELWYPLVI